MRFPESPYISQEDDGAVRIKGTRVGLQTIIGNFKEGESPETIAQEYSTVTRAQVYGAIAYYLENQTALDEFFAEVDRKFFSMVRPLSEQNPKLYERLEAARQQLKSK